jgi:hypothetical protein
MSEGKHVPTSRETQPRNVSEEARSDADIQGDLNVVGNSFLWLYNFYDDQLTLLEQDVSKKEEPSWSEKLAETLLEVAMGKASSAVIGLVAKKAAAVFANELEDLEGDVAKAVKTINFNAPQEPSYELVSDMFKKGVDFGLKAGKDKLLRGAGATSQQRFFNGHRHAALQMQKENDDNWQTDGRKRVKSASQAKALAMACSRDAMEEAARTFYVGTRDAWVSYVAQRWFGEFEHGETDMRPQSVRDMLNRGAPGWIPKEAPEAGSLLGNPGVLEVWADLPATNGWWMNGKPQVTRAVLAGISKPVREQYAGMKLAQCAIPRQIVAHVQGGTDFVVNLNEHHKQGHLPKREAAWLEGRATVDQPENWDSNDKREIGLEMLLNDLVVENLE